MTDQPNEKLLFKDEVSAMQGAVFAVDGEMGCGFLETVYQECLENELRFRKQSFSETCISWLESKRAS